MGSPPPPPIGVLLLLLLVISVLGPADAFDAMDPNGNITIQWDVLLWRDDGYTAMVTINNNQQFRHIERPGWRLNWEWAGEEVIWDMRGAEATEQGDCSNFTGGNLPHCCSKKPVIVDLLPGAPYNMQTANCCRGGVLSSLKQDLSTHISTFQLTVGRALSDADYNISMPANFSLGIPGYACGAVAAYPPTKFRSDHGRRKTQALRTWKAPCSFSQTTKSLIPNCCVSLSAFYNDTLVQCPHCSCGCEDAPSPFKCVRNGEQPPFLQLPHDQEESAPPFVRCTQHMCPIRVHWHIKTSYKEYWRVKITITNFNLFKNYSDWNLLVEHPNFENLTEVFSFKYAPLDLYPTNDSGLFWGIPYYNDMLLQDGVDGNVQTEILLHKDSGVFTFNGGWAFPRRIAFNGEICVMPLPDMYPRMPNGIPKQALVGHISVWIQTFMVFTVLLFC